jgi:alanine dehydrogenase
MEVFVSDLRLGVIRRSSKQDEHRLPLHPQHFEVIPEPVRPRLFFEEGYGRPWGVTGGELANRFGGIAPRRELFADSDVILLPKPVPEDLREMRPGTVLWGWPHCVQQREMTQVAIERKLTLLAWDAMFTWRTGGIRDMHVFYRNNEMAGYCAVLHALGLAGLDGLYGPSLKAVVLSLGSVSRGAIHALLGRGIHDVTVYTQRPPWSVHDQVVGCRYGQMNRGADGGRVDVVEEDGRHGSLADVLAEADLVVNGILQDTDAPLMFLAAGEEERLKNGSLIVDVSCDEGMGFSFARPTSFESPTFPVGGATYYAVDHAPSHLWRSATWEISRAVVPFLDEVTEGPAAWERNETLRRAIEIRDGVVRNPKILRFQNRASEYPHTPRE